MARPRADAGNGGGPPPPGGRGARMTHRLRKEVAYWARESTPPPESGLNPNPNPGVGRRRHTWAVTAKQQGGKTNSLPPTRKRMTDPPDLFGPVWKKIRSRVIPFQFRGVYVLSQYFFLESRWIDETRDQMMNGI